MLQSSRVWAALLPGLTRGLFPLGGRVGSALMEPLPGSCSPRLFRSSGQQLAKLGTQGYSLTCTQQVLAKHGRYE